jgi:hypothetical protein
VADTAPRGGKRGSLSRSYAWCIWASFYPLHNHQKVQRPRKLLHLPPTTTSASTNQPFHESCLTAAHSEGPRVRDPRRPEPLTLRCFWNQVDIPHLVLASTAHMKCCSYGLRHMLLADHHLGVLPCTRQSEIVLAEHTSQHRKRHLLNASSHAVRRSPDRRWCRVSFDLSNHLTQFTFRVVSFTLHGSSKFQMGP